MKYHPSFVPIPQGTEFGKWTVLEYIKGSTYLCRCDCGVLKHISKTSLIKGDRDRGCKRCVSGFPAGFCDAYSAYKQNAKVRGISFELSREDALVLMRLPCQYCRTIPEIFGGIDRVDNFIGYILENCVPCCSLCNHMKCDMAVSDFLAHAHKIAGENRCHN
jgi:hypothetical protein